MRQRITIRGRLADPALSVVRQPSRRPPAGDDGAAGSGTVAAPRHREWTRARRAAPGLVALLAVAGTLLIQGYRLRAAPDVFGDEGSYLEVARYIARGAGIKEANRPYFWHPPLFMLIEAAYIKIRGLDGMRPLPELFAVRWVNVGFSAATAGLLALLGCRMRGLRMGLVVSALFILDPYVQRINRRNMLETATIFFVVLALYLFLTGEDWPSPWRWLGPGIALGLAVLTKEPAVIFLLVPVVYGLLADRRRLGDALRAVGAAAGVYIAYVIGVFSFGLGSLYLAFKWYDIHRISHALFGTELGPPPGGGTLHTGRKLYASSSLISLGRQYASSYLLIGLALAGIVILVLRFTFDTNARMLAVWMAVGTVAGAGLVPVSDQYSYYLVVPAIVVAGYLTDHAIVHYRASPAGTFMAVASALVVAVCLAFGGYRWVSTYATGSDDCYARVASYVQAHVPPGAQIISSNEISNYFLTYRYHVRMDRTPAAVVYRGVRFFILSSKDAWAGNQGTTSAFYGWVRRHSRPLYICRDPTFWKLGVYYRWGGVHPARAGTGPAGPP